MIHITYMIFVVVQSVGESLITYWLTLERDARDQRKKTYFILLM
jgi:hypothetical protein